MSTDSKKIANSEKSKVAKLQDIVAKTIEQEKLITENHGAEIICQFCETVYNFSENDLKELIKNDE